CGDHYVRPMSSYSLLAALSGVQYTIRPKAKLTFRPQWHSNLFFIAGESSGTLNIEKENGSLRGSLRVHKGELRVDEFEFSLQDSRDWKHAQMESARIEILNDGFRAIALGKALTPGEQLTFSV